MKKLRFLIITFIVIVAIYAGVNINKQFNQSNKTFAYINKGKLIIEDILNNTQKVVLRDKWIFDYDLNLKHNVACVIEYKINTSCLRLYDLTTNKSTCIIKDGCINGVKISPNGKYIAAYIKQAQSNCNTMRIYDIANKNWISINKAVSQYYIWNENGDKLAFSIVEPYERSDIYDRSDKSLAAIWSVKDNTIKIISNERDLYSNYPMKWVNNSILIIKRTEENSIYKTTSKVNAKYFKLDLNRNNIKEFSLNDVSVQRIIKSIDSLKTAYNVDVSLDGNYILYADSCRNEDAFKIILLDLIKNQTREIVKGYMPKWIYNGYCIRSAPELSHLPAFLGEDIVKNK